MDLTFRNFAQSFIGCLELGRSLTIIELMEKFAPQDQAFQAPTLFPPAYVVCGKVMFSVVSLCSRRASGPHMTYIKICSLPPSHATPEPVQICSLRDPPDLLASGRLASKGLQLVASFILVQVI